MKGIKATGDRIEALVLELSSMEDSRVRDRAEELVRLLLELYGAGLTRVVELVHSLEDPRSRDRLLEALAGDDLVASLLMIHGIHPEAADERVRKALERVRPYLGTHGGGVTLVGVEDGVVRLRMEGTCTNCASSDVTKKLAIERAVLEAAPEVSRVEFEEPAVSTLPSLVAIPLPGAGVLLSEAAALVCPLPAAAP